LIALTLAGAWAGWKARQWTFEHTDTLRWRFDIRNNLHYGLRAVDEGWLNVYGNVAAETPSGQYGLDYPPLRLLVVRQWAAWVRGTYGSDEWRKEFALHRPLLAFNAATEAASAVAVFLLIRMWVRRSSVELPREQSPWLGVPRGMLGAALVWFSPASHLSAHGWPCGDCWVPPFFLFAVLLACGRRWFWSGLLLGVGTMLKGQQLMVMPLFVLWALFMWQPTHALRWLIGYGLAVALVASPWLLRDEATRAPSVPVIALLFAVVSSAVLVLAAMWRRGLRCRAAVERWGLATAVAVTTTLAAAGGWLGTDLTWLRVGFMYGAGKFPSLHMGTSYNLSTLLAATFRWRQLNDVLFTLPLGTGWPVTIRGLLSGLSIIALALSALGMAIHSLRPNRSFLAATAAPWVALFAFGPQMHCRYLLFGSTAAALLAGLGIGPALLAVLLTVATWMMIVHMMHDAWNGRLDGLPRGFGSYIPETHAGPLESFLRGAFPGWTYLVLMCTLILLYLALRPLQTSSPYAKAGPE
jgi:hypothetical protein